MNGNDGGQGSSGTVGIVNIQQIPLAVAAVGDIAALGDSFGQRNRLVPLIVIDGCTNVKHDRLKRHFQNPFRM